MRPADRGAPPVSFFVAAPVSVSVSVAVFVSSFVAAAAVVVSPEVAFSFRYCRVPQEERVLGALSYASPRLAHFFPCQ